jgi:acyl carrier protein
MPLDAAEIGFERTLAALKLLLAERFGIACDSMSAGDPLFSIGVGLTSLEGVEFLCEVEKQFGLDIKDLDWWVYETPTLGRVAEHIVELAKRRHVAA